MSRRGGQIELTNGWRRSVGPVNLSPAFGATFPPVSGGRGGLGGVSLSVHFLSLWAGERRAHVICVVAHAPCSSVVCVRDGRTCVRHVFVCVCVCVCVRV